MPNHNYYRPLLTRQKLRQKPVVKISPPPIPPTVVVKTAFELLDTNKDGILTRQEYFTDSATSNFDALRAAELMRLCACAYTQYDNFKVNETWAIPAPYNNVTVIYAAYEKMYGAYHYPVPISPPNASAIPIGFIAEYNNDVNIVFRGTENAEEWEQNIKCIYTPCLFLKEPHNEMVHKGFYELYTAGTTNGNNSDSPQNTIKNYLNSLSREKVYNVWITGHSLGGALATLATCDIVVNTKHTSAKMYNFASPRVGDSDFVNTFNNNTLFSGTTRAGCWRIVNTYDLVPMLPLEIQGYKHVNGLYEITFGNKDLLYLPNILTDHSYATYLATMVKVLKSSGYTATQLKTKYFTSVELSAAGYTSSDLTNAGYTV